MTARRPKVLIVDDEASILRTTAMLLEELGYETALCGDPALILAAVEEERPDVLLQDVRMPGLDLEGLVRRLRETPAGKGLPIVLFTASLEAGEIRERLGGVGVLEKPFDPVELAQTLDAARREALA